MSDLVSRLAARVVGATTTTASPRPVPVFGQETGYTEDDLATPEVHDTQSMPPVVVPVDMATPVPGQTSRGRIESAPAAPRRPRRRDSQPAVTEPDPVTVEPVDEAEGSRTSDAAPVSAFTPVGRQLTPEPDEARSPAGNLPRNAQLVTPAAPTDDARTAQPVATAVPAAPASLPPQIPGQAPPSASPAADQIGGGEGPVVRIHIGRLDVRPAPEPANPPRHRPDPPEPRISLTDYLRGRREEP